MHRQWKWCVSQELHRFVRPVNDFSGINSMCAGRHGVILPLFLRHHWTGAIIPLLRESRIRQKVGIPCGQVFPEILHVQQTQTGPSAPCSAGFSTCLSNVLLSPQFFHILLLCCPVEVLGDHSEKRSMPILQA